MASEILHASRLFYRNSLWTLRSSGHSYITSSFTLPKTDSDLSGNDVESLRKRLHQCAFSLVINKKNGEGDESENEKLYNHTIALLNQLDSSDASLGNLRKQIAELEKMISELVVSSSNPPISLFSPSKISARTQHTGRLSLDMDIYVKHLFQEDTTNVKAKQMKNPRIHTFFSAQVTPVDRRKHFQTFSGMNGTHANNVSFRINECANFIDGQFAVLRFTLHGDFETETETGAPSGYYRHRPFYQGFLFLSEIKKPGDRFTVYLKDACFAFIDKKLQRDTKTQVILDIVVKDFQLTNSAFTRTYDENVRSSHIEKMHQMTRRYYNFLEREGEPAFPEIRKMHVPRWPCNMYDIVLPAAFYLLDLPDNPPPASLFKFALEMHDMTDQEFSSIAKKQFDSYDHHLDPQFNRVCIVVWRTLCMFTNMCDYVPDVRLSHENGTNEDVERFIDVFYTLAADCEDLAKAIIAQFMAWSEYPLDQALKHSQGLYYFIRVLRLFVCSSMKGSAYGVSAKESERTDINSLICHFWSVVIPWHIFAKWINKKYQPTYPWEKHLTTWVLEGTNDCHPSMRPLEELCENEKIDQVKKEMSQLRLVKNKLINYAPLLSELSSFGYSVVKRDGPSISDYYHYANEIWLPYYMLKDGKGSTTFELYLRDNNGKYGIPISAFAYEPERIEIKSVLDCSPNELEICLETVKQQWPVVLPGDDDIALSIPALERLQIEFPVDVSQIANASGYCTSYIRYSAKDLKSITSALLDTLRRVLTERVGGIYGLQYRYYRVKLGMDSQQQYACLIDIRLFFK